MPLFAAMKNLFAHYKQIESLSILFHKALSYESHTTACVRTAICVKNSYPDLLKTVVGTLLQ